MKESLVDLTGGVVTTLLLEVNKDFKEIYKKLQSCLKKGYLLACVKTDKELRGKRAEDPDIEQSNGLLINHA